MNKNCKELLDWKLLLFDSIDSTNIYGLKLLDNEIKDNTAILAKMQTNGKGRMGRVWESTQDNGVWASYVFANKCDIQNAIRALSVAIITTLKDMGIKNSSIKWPNDILIGNKKIAGLLAEKSSEQDGFVLGFGLNVNQNILDFPLDLQKIATSIFIETQKQLDTENIFLQITKTFSGILKNKTQDTMICYIKNSSSLNRWCKIDNKRFYTKSILPDGSLLVVNQENKEETIYSGTLRYESDN